MRYAEVTRQQSVTSYVTNHFVNFIKGSVPAK
jgi:hypothetical protein